MAKSETQKGKLGFLIAELFYKNIISQQIKL